MYGPCAIAARVCLIRAELLAWLSLGLYVLPKPVELDLNSQPRAGVAAQADWNDLDIDDVDVRLKWAGLFHRKKRTPGKFMMRLKVRHQIGVRLVSS